MAKRNQTKPDTRRYDDIGDDLVITRIARRTWGPGTWISGTIAGHQFEGLVFPEHAEYEEYELGKSRISKLCLRRIADKRTVFNWDRGQDIKATNDLTRAIVDFLAAGLADRAYGN
jgi:hypothetical protein